MNTNNVELDAEFSRLEKVAPEWSLAVRRDSAIDTFAMKWGMPKDEVGEHVDSYLRQGSMALKTGPKLNDAEEAEAAQELLAMAERPRG
ncbi:hypothetical protein [Paucibacter soli]|uniref:hypothetical protein n=1 Tax=Paucibacter soli TaxID=3133433 RepID=UPI0030AD746B